MAHDRLIVTQFRILKPLLARPEARQKKLDVVHSYSRTILLRACHTVLESRRDPISERLF
jgi:hypothetical protein